MKLHNRTIKKMMPLMMAASLFFTIGLVMTSCKKPGNTYEVFDVSNLRVINGLSGRSGVKFYLDSFNLTLTGTINYGVVSPTYYVVKSGSRVAKFYSTVSTDTFAKKDIQLDPNKDYTFFLAGAVGAAKYFLTEDDLTETTSDKVKIRLANLAVTNSNVDVTIQYVDALLPPQPEVTVLTNVASESISKYVQASVPTSKGNTVARPHTIRIYEAGTSNLIASRVGVDLRGTTINTFILAGIRGGSPAPALNAVREWLDW